MSEFVTRPRDLDGASLRELVEGFESHRRPLVNAEHAIGRPEAAGRLHGAALDSLAIGEQVIRQMLGSRWVTVRDALTYGATVEQVAAALDVDPAAVVDGLTGWANRQHEHGLMTAEKRAQVLALLPRGDR